MKITLKTRSVTVFRDLVIYKLGNVLNDSTFDKQLNFISNYTMANILVLMIFWFLVSGDNLESVYYKSKRKKLL